MKSFLPKESECDREWLVIDAEGKPLGRLAVKIADLLRGKNKPIFSPQVDVGSFVIVVNAAKVKLSGGKEDQKIYQRYSHYRSGLKKITARTMRAQHPERIIEHAVKGMLPKNTLCRGMMTRLRVCAGAEHSHAAQKPRKVTVL